MQCPRALSWSATTPPPPRLVYDYISGFRHENTDGSTMFQNGSLELFRNYDDYGNRYPRPHTAVD